MNGKAAIDFAANVSLALFGAAGIMLVSLGYFKEAGICGLLSEPAYAYFSWKSRSWALALLTVWWTGWWGYMLV